MQNCLHGNRIVLAGCKPKYGFPMYMNLVVAKEGTKFTNDKAFCQHHIFKSRTAATLRLSHKSFLQMRLPAHCGRCFMDILRRCGNVPETTWGLGRACLVASHTVSLHLHLQTHTCWTRDKRTFWTVLALILKKNHREAA